MTGPAYRGIMRQSATQPASGSQAIGLGYVSTEPCRHHRPEAPAGTLAASRRLGARASAAAGTWPRPGRSAQPGHKRGSVPAPDAGRPPQLLRSQQRRELRADRKERLGVEVADDEAPKRDHRADRDLL